MTTRYQRHQALEAGQRHRPAQPAPHGSRTRTRATTTFEFRATVTGDQATLGHFIYEMETDPIPVNLEECEIATRDAQGAAAHDDDARFVRAAGGDIAAREQQRHGTAASNGREKQPRQRQCGRARPDADG